MTKWLVTIHPTVDSTIRAIVRAGRYTDAVRIAKISHPQAFHIYANRLYS